MERSNGTFPFISSSRSRRSTEPLETVSPLGEIPKYFSCSTDSGHSGLLRRTARLLLRLVRMVQLSLNDSLGSRNIRSPLGPSLREIRSTDVGYLQFHVQLFDVSENCKRTRRCGENVRLIVFALGSTGLLVSE